MQKRRRHAVSRSMQGGTQSIADKLRGSRINLDALQRDVIAHAFLLQGDKALYGGGTRADFAHRIQVQLEMAVMPLGQAIIRFFTENDLLINRAA